ncbi:type VI secretion system tube protein Hcp [Enterobacter ludwigii]|uniref:Hcp family type VI secretion system effector n=1 Tax=Enterobacterales TaxID=91347 RepID=UPI000E0FAEA9|nr:MULTISPECIES: type VI secretion system tube protein TssD [Enterobacterales]MCF8581508.1 type VI secretion system tube protein Hcp [Enterobacter ludwigii]NJQ19056.1 type VI secretion system tube protein Hcp [Pantoea sp. LS15]NKF45652.1 type VI secretion system tube protein Hcp [Pantoea sp. LS15]QBC01982.1 type VI secretion system tube protein Hcp [Enterobacter cloacae]RDK15955.1 type VI secretion system tube protein Hcp [Enterobacter sp. 9-2]
MSLPSYMFLYDENGILIPGDCTATGRVGSTEVASSQFGVFQAMDSFTGRYNGTRQHDPFVFRKEIDKLTPYMFISVCQNRRFKKVVFKYYEVSTAGIEMETFNIEMEEAGICSFKFGHSFTSGSLHSNMNEIIGLRSTKITVNYLPGNVSYSDSWYTERQ